MIKDILNKINWFIVPIIFVLLSLILFFYARTINDWGSIGYAIMGILLLFVSLLTLVIIFVSKYFRWRWYVTIVVMLLSLPLSYGILFLLANI